MLDQDPGVGHHQHFFVLELACGYSRRSPGLFHDPAEVEPDLRDQIPGPLPAQPQVHQSAALPVDGREPALTLHPVIHYFPDQADLVRSLQIRQPRTPARQNGAIDDQHVVIKDLLQLVDAEARVSLGHDLPVYPGEMIPGLVMDRRVHIVSREPVSQAHRAAPKLEDRPGPAHRTVVLDILFEDDQIRHLTPPALSASGTPHSS